MHYWCCWRVWERHKEHEESGRETGLWCCRSFWCPSTVSRNPKHIHLTEKHQHVIEAWTSCRQLVISHRVDNLINTWNSCCITAYVNVETNYSVAKTLEILQVNAYNWGKKYLDEATFSITGLATLMICPISWTVLFHPNIWSAEIRWIYLDLCSYLSFPNIL